ncbi:MAG TPA: hypothetical protein VHP37_12185 [Burkholderiales bacterium]|jgi:hypothetical protein|nr:hypothetical protein [Burkholderiales bacterium]
MDSAFIADVETWGSAGEFLDVVTLRDGKVVAITSTNLAVYDDASAFEQGEPRALVDI